MKWRQIEEYDRLKKKPDLVVFRFKITDHGRNYLPEMFDVDRYRGSRVCTHWIELPEFKEP